jgi:hypothetical protein
LRITVSNGPRQTGAVWQFFLTGTREYILNFVEAVHRCVRELGKKFRQHGVLRAADVAIESLGSCLPCSDNLAKVSNHANTDSDAEPLGRKLADPVGHTGKQFGDLVLMLKACYDRLGGIQWYVERI